MKIKVTKRSYEDVCALPEEKHKHPQHQSPVLRGLMRTLSKRILRDVNFTWETGDLKGVRREHPCLYLMNHSSFTDLEIATQILGHHPYHIVCTSDGFVGKEKLMRRIGCIPTRKFQTDLALIRDMDYALKVLRGNILMYPEASYTFDGTATPLPESLGKCIRALGVPVLMIRTHGAFLRDPLYNGLRLRRVDVSAELYTIFTKEETKTLSPEELNEGLKKAFTFDNFREQEERGIHIREPFRAEGLNRVLYKCPHCKSEGSFRASGISIRCDKCGKEYELTELGRMKAVNGITEYPHIPDWYAWERECVREELRSGTYRLEVPVLIRMLVDTKSIYEVGEGTLVHDLHGFTLTGCDGKLSFRQKPMASYGLYSDYYWYELGDMICIGDKHALYYCFPQTSEDIVAKTRLAAEELYKLARSAVRAGT
ncbi:MAG: 1-acyl-sn-glycerol-3-phosphate acyltransferase [Lachnospiraceae bacterium]|nr:1-acyl-sn-glycerol-3-phosphate acyltransferase [Lachnospiraceae bacterium]